VTRNKLLAMKPLFDHLGQEDFFKGNDLVGVKRGCHCKPPQNYGKS